MKWPLPVLLRRRLVYSSQLLEPSALYSQTFSSVFATSDTYRSRPSPLILVSYTSPLNLPNDSILTKVARLSLVKALLMSKFLVSQLCSHYVAAKSVKLRTISPLLQVTMGPPPSNFFRSIATVVPFPVPLSPTKTITSDDREFFATWTSISFATSSADLPNISTLI